MEGRTDSISQDPSSYYWESNKYNCSRLAFESQIYEVGCWSNQKIIEQQSVCKKSAQSIPSFFKTQWILGSHEQNK